VLVELAFQGKKKAVKHKASATISDLLAMYEKRMGAAGGGSALRVCDEHGVEQGGEVTLGLLHSKLSLPKGPVRLSFEEDDWFND